MSKESKDEEAATDSSPDACGGMSSEVQRRDDVPVLEDGAEHGADRAGLQGEVGSQDQGEPEGQPGSGHDREVPGATSEEPSRDSGDGEELKRRGEGAVAIELAKTIFRDSSGRLVVGEEDVVAWGTLLGREYVGVIQEMDSNVAIVRCTDGIVRAVEM